MKNLLKDNESWLESVENTEMLEGKVSFEVTKEQKEYMENHMDEVDEELEDMFDVVPNTIYFEPSCNENCFTCTAVFFGEKYFEARQVKLWLSESDFDILSYALSNVDWSEYESDRYGGESDDAACIHLDEIEDQIREYFR